MILRSWQRAMAIAIAVLLELTASYSRAEFRQYPVKWEQVDPAFGTVLGLEREVYEPADWAGRFVIALQTGKGAKLADYEAHWSVTHAGKTVASNTGSLSDGMLVVDFPLAGLDFGTYEASVEIWDASHAVASEKRTFEFRADSEAQPLPTGRIPLIFPSGVPATAKGYPLSFGVPMPKGALKDLSKVRVVDSAGKPIPVQFTVRSQWSYVPEAGIRWLGVDLQLPATPAWWPNRKETPYFLEYGGNVAPVGANPSVVLSESAVGIRVNSGPLDFLIRADGCNLIDDVSLDGKKVLSQGGKGGAYLVDQEGTVYRAANDRKPSITIEEPGPLRAVIRVDGWYVKDGASGESTNFRLPTDRLCKFVTRLEVYAGLPWVRVLHSWINTSDSYSVAFRDVGFSLVRPGNREVQFGVEVSPSVNASVGPDGVYLLQHLPDRFEVYQGNGKEIASGKHSDGTMSAATADGDLITISHRETWQRFPKEIEVLPDELRFHIWPSHGKDHPEIDAYSKEHYHQLWFAHQGKLLDLKFPWESLFAVMRFVDDPSTGIYKPAGTAMGGVHSSAMGTAITSDLLIRFGAKDEQKAAQADVAAFQARPTALAHPDWVTSSGALGLVHPYDPERFPELERAAQDSMFGIWNLQDKTGEFGMYLYRGWHHSTYEGQGFWDPYRLYSAGHHYEPYIPWLYFARSGDPRHGEMGMATMRNLTDLGIIHYDDPRYDHEEFWSRQKRLVGSTRHTNGFVMWGGDHGILGHLTSYGGVILAYYLTGDLRFRQIVTEEWQHTLLDDRANSEWNKAARMNWGKNVDPEINRDNNQALGEMIDLYQLTHDPRILAFIQPCVQSMEQNMYRWSRELESTLLFRRTPQLKEQLVQAALDYRKNPKSQLYKAIGTYSNARLALAAWADPTKHLELDALWATDLSETAKFGRGFLDWNQASPPACEIPDRFLEMPLVQYVTQSLYQPVSRAANSLQYLPLASELGGKTPSRVIVRKDKDEPFNLRLRGVIESGNAWLKVADGNGKTVFDQAVPAGADYSVTIPQDGYVGDYLVLILVQAEKDRIELPISSLPKEVYPVSFWMQPGLQKFYVGRPNIPEGKFELAPGSNSVILKAADGGDVLAKRTGEDRGKSLICSFPAGGLWFISTAGRYFTTPAKASLLLALSPEAFFQPSSEILSLK